MKIETQSHVLTAGSLILTVVSIVAIVALVLRLERAQVFLLALILVAGLTIASIIAAIALLVRARRPEKPPIERHVYHTRERVMDGRQPGQTHVVALPNPGYTSGIGVLYPHLLRGAYQAGRQTAQADLPDDHDETAHQSPGEWNGEIFEIEPQ